MKLDELRKESNQILKLYKDIMSLKEEESGTPDFENKKSKYIKDVIDLIEKINKSLNDNDFCETMLPNNAKEITNEAIEILEDSTHFLNIILNI